MTALVDARPPGIDVFFRPGNTFTLTLTWPAASLGSRTFTAALDAASLALSITGDVMTITASEAQTSAAVEGGLFVLTETTGGHTEELIAGRWQPSSGFAATTNLSVSVTAGAASVAVSVNPSTAAFQTNTVGALQTRGAVVDQTLARTETDRWLTLIRQVGTGAPPHASYRYTAGDISDGIRNADGSRVYVGPDWVANKVVDADDTYGAGQVFIPTENIGISENSPGGTFSAGQQLYATGSSGPWLNAVTQGGLTAGTIWWPASIVADASNNLFVGCIWVTRAPTSLAPYGQPLGNTVVKLNVFGGYSSHMQLGLLNSKFFVECMRRASPYVYTLGGEHHPPAVAAQVGDPVYAVGDINALRNQLDYSHRLARVPDTTVDTLSAWQFWDGSTWGSDSTAAVELRDDEGRVIHGSAGFAQVRPGYWVLVAHQMVDTHLDVYHYSGTAPTGPWTRHARVPLPTIGTVIDGGIQIAWHTKILEYMPAPPEHSMALLTRWYKDAPAETANINIRRFAPLHVIVPWY